VVDLAEADSLVVDLVEAGKIFKQKKDYFLQSFFCLKAIIVHTQIPCRTKL
jgi:hypothetical protein